LPNLARQTIAKVVPLKMDADGAKAPSNACPEIISALEALPPIVLNGSSNRASVQIAQVIRNVSHVAKIHFAAGVLTPILVAKPTTMG